MTDSEGLARFVPPAVHRALRLLDRRSGQAIFWICVVGIPLKSSAGH